MSTARTLLSSATYCTQILKMEIVHKFSKVFGPRQINNFKGTFASKSQKIFADLGLVHFSEGIGTLMPFLVKSLRKLESVVRKEMYEIGALEIMLPVLTKSDLLEKSGRLKLPELFKVNGRENKSYVLSPTCEEAVTHLMTLYNSLTYKNLPIRLYQISPKFRDERRGRCGLLRSKEFLMKDLYCFDTNEDTSEECYQEVINQYHNFFGILKVPYVFVEGNTGDIGGLKSHEFHFLSETGEDKLVLCNNCGLNENLNMKGSDGKKCRKCESGNVTVKNAIEVGHAFKLGTVFTEPFCAKYINSNQEQQLLQMSCFGLGLTRILAASVEVLSKQEEIRWPISLAPYIVCIIPPKAGSKEEAAAGDTANSIYYSLNQSFKDDVFIDDQTYSTIGKRLPFYQTLGIPFQVVIGKSICDDPPMVEVIDCNTGSINLIQPPDVNQFIVDKLADMFKVQSHREKVFAC